ncbi:MAG TPA: hypothetical protein VE715_22450, partial [Blastocatellia bacterium]|nr:hypothetical protein [Blastocatellia bacterium]
MRRANGAILGILLATVAVPAFAADMPVKAAPPPPPPDWSGVYTGVAAGGAWGRQNLNAPVSPINNLFGTSADRILNGTPALIQPDFDMGGNCVIGNCNRLRTSGFIGGGFAGVQKQWGNWVVGIEGSWDWTSMKKSLSATTSDVEDVIRFVPTTTVPVPTTVSATVTRSVDVSSKIDQIADIRGKFGFANGFMGPNWLFYFTSGAAVGHFERTLNLTQTVSVAG